jgi:hypothetical protein
MILTICSFCGGKVTIPFKCKLCSRHHCNLHRLPENHNCANLINYSSVQKYESSEKIVQQTQQQKISLKQRSKQSQKSYTKNQNIKANQFDMRLDWDFWSSHNRFLDIMLVGIFVANRNLLFIGKYDNFLASVVIVGLSFIIVFVSLSLFSFILNSGVRTGEIYYKYYFWRIGLSISILLTIQFKFYPYEIFTLVLIGAFIKLDPDELHFHHLPNLLFLIISWVLYFINYFIGLTNVDILILRLTFYYTGTALLSIGFLNLIFNFRNNINASSYSSYIIFSLFIFSFLIMFLF